MVHLWNADHLLSICFSGSSTSVIIKTATLTITLPSQDFQPAGTRVYQGIAQVGEMPLSTVWDFGALTEMAVFYEI
jgi:hypothetical protein